MKEIWYCACGGRIDEVVVVKETPMYITLEGFSTRRHKQANGIFYSKDRNEAKEMLIKYLNTKVQVTSFRLKIYLDQLEKAKGA